MTNPFRGMFTLLSPTAVAPVRALKADKFQNANLRRCLITGAAALMCLLMAAGTLSADTFDINVNFGGGVIGTGSFNTNGTCDPCNAGTGLTNFTFTVGDDTFTEADAVAGLLQYLRNSNTLNSAVVSGGDHAGDSLLFGASAPAGKTDIAFGDPDDGPGVVATGTISAVPEPGSIVLLVTALAVTVFSARRKLRGRVRAS